jgi:hypothetical protein
MRTTCLCECCRRPFVPTKSRKQFCTTDCHLGYRKHGPAPIALNRRPRGGVHVVHRTFQPPIPGLVAASLLGGVVRYAR